MSKHSSKKGKVAATNGGFPWAHCAVFAAVCAVVIGFYAWSANSGVLELMGSGAKDSYYNLQVQAFQDGHLNLERQVPPEYGDPPRFTWDGNYGLDDLSYYKGKLYLYFGVTPALVLFWPYAALTGQYLLHKDAAVFFFSAGFLAGAGLLWAVWRRYFKECGVWVAAAGMLALGLGNFAPAILGRCDVYEVAVSCGYALTMLALCGIWRALHDTQHRWRWLAAASLAYGLAVGARPSLLLGAVILLVPVIQAWREKGRVWPLLAAACGPIMAVGLGLAIYNAQRFDNPLEFGQRYQLPLAEHQQFNWRYLWFNIRVGFLEPAQWSGDFPFVDNIAAPKQPAGYWQVVDAFGVLTNIPLVWLALALPLGWRSRPEEERARFRLLLGAVAALFAMCALPLLFHDSMCLRYELEYASPLVLLAVVGVFGLERAPAARPVWRRAVRCGWGLLLAFTVAFNVFAHFKLEADDWQFYGYGLFQLGRLDEAIVQFQKSLRINPDYPLAHNNLGNALLRKGIVDEGTAHLLKALQFDPDYADANTSLGNVLLQEGKLDEAVAHYEKALKKEPNSAVAHNSLANALMEEDKFDEAIAHFQRALEIQPGAAPAHYGLATAFMRTRRLDEAIIEYQKGMQADPNYAPAYFALGVALEARGRFGEAIAAYQKALQLNPSDLAAWNNLAWLLATAPDASLRDGGKALELARQADLQTGSNNMVILHTLAAAYAETGKFPEAVEAAQHALRLAQAQSNSVMTEALQNELEFYQTERPFHRAQAEH